MYICVSLLESKHIRPSFQGLHTLMESLFSKLVVTETVVSSNCYVSVFSLYRHAKDYHCAIPSLVQTMDDNGRYSFIKNE